jgi:hypothetical protein
MFTIDGEDKEEAQLVYLLSKLDMVAVLESKEIFDSVMQPFSVVLGKAVSKKEREELNLKNPSLIYGEVTFETMGIVFEKIRKVYGRPHQGTSGPSGVMQTRGGIFYDLGAGTGKGVIAAAVLYDFEVCYGIEYLEGLFSLSLDALNSYNTRGKAKLSSREHETHCQFIHGDFLQTRTKDWRDADVVFANSTCYEPALMSGIARLATGMKKGSFFITLTKRLPCQDFTVVDFEMHPMSWGEATVFVMQKTTDPRPANINEELPDIV